MTHSGGKPHNVGDKGQRFEVRYIDDGGAEKVFGWSNDLSGAAKMVGSIALAPAMQKPMIVDRNPPCPPSTGTPKASAAAEFAKIIPDLVEWLTTRQLQTIGQATTAQSVMILGLAILPYISDDSAEAQEAVLMLQALLAGDEQ